MPKATQTGSRKSVTNAGSSRAQVTHGRAESNGAGDVEMHEKLGGCEDKSDVHTRTNEGDLDLGQTNRHNCEDSACTEVHEHPDAHVRSKSAHNCDTFDTSGRNRPDDNHVSGLSIVRRFEFSADLQRMSVVVRGDEGRACSFVKGSPEAVMSLCDKSTIPGHFTQVCGCCFVCETVYNSLWAVMSLCPCVIQRLLYEGISCRCVAAVLYMNQCTVVLGLSGLNVTSLCILYQDILRRCVAAVLCVNQCPIVLGLSCRCVTSVYTLYQCVLRTFGVCVDASAALCFVHDSLTSSLQAVSLQLKQVRTHIDVHVDLHIRIQTLTYT
jgi:hypothetical protein